MFISAITTEFVTLSSGVSLLSIIWFITLYSVVFLLSVGSVNGKFMTLWRVVSQLLINSVTDSYVCIVNECQGQCGIQNCKEVICKFRVLEIEEHFEVLFEIRRYIRGVYSKVSGLAAWS
jgi:hypothetical protein